MDVLKDRLDALAVDIKEYLKSGMPLDDTEILLKRISRLMADIEREAPEQKDSLKYLEIVHGLLTAHSERLKTGK